MSIYTGRVSEEYEKAYFQQYYLDHRDHLLPKNTLYGRQYRRINEAACKEKGMNYYYRHRTGFSKTRGRSITRRENRLPNAGRL